MKESLTEVPGASTLISKDLSDMGTSSVELMESLKGGAPVSLDFAICSCSARPHPLNLPSNFRTIWRLGLRDLRTASRSLSGKPTTPTALTLGSEVTIEHVFLCWFFALWEVHEGSRCTYKALWNQSYAIDLFKNENHSKNRSSAPILNSGAFPGIGWSQWRSNRGGV